MKRKKRKCQPQIRSEQEYLFRLGRNLLFYFPAEQVMEILADYKEYFHSGSEKRTVEENIKQWGTPVEVTQALLKEYPQARRYAAKWTLLWGVVLIFSVFAMFHIQNGVYLTIALPPLSLFGAMHGRAQNRLEHYFQRTRPEGKILTVHILTAVFVILSEWEAQYIIKNIERVLSYNEKMSAQLAFTESTFVGLILEIEFIFLVSLAFFLFLWTIKKAITSSVKYIADMAYLSGAVLFFWDIKEYLLKIYIINTPEIKKLFFYPVFYYGTGLGLALLWKLLLKPGKERMTYEYTAKERNT